MFSPLAGAKYSSFQAPAYELIQLAILTLSSTINNSDGNERQPGLQEAYNDSLSSDTPAITESLLHKNFEHLVAQQQDAMLKQQQIFLTNFQIILLSG